MKKLSILALAIGLLPGFSSCCKEGLNGNATVVVFPKKNGVPIVNHSAYPDTVYVKFNAKDLPGLRPSDYDTYFVGEAGEDHVHCEKLKCGDYYIFAAGLDTTTSTRVTGGMHVHIKHKERKNEFDVDVSVNY
ncbi:MAG TPA: hypothetical protein VI112_01345 [Bacteroidia bacterium]|jgi:hypothetical protein